MLVFLFFAFEDEDFQKLKQNDQKAFEKLYVEYSKKIYSFILLKSHYNKDITEEVFSETFLSAYKSLKLLKENSGIQCWLLRIASRRLADHFRKKYREKKYLSDEEISESADSQNRDNNDEDNRAYILQLAMDNLKPEWRTIIKMKYVEGLSQEEISLKIGKNIKAVEGLLFRARERLKIEAGLLQRNGL